MTKCRFGTSTLGWGTTPALLSGCCEWVPDALCADHAEVISHRSLIKRTAILQTMFWSWFFLYRIIFSEISLKFVPNNPINTKPAFAYVGAWCRPGEKLLYQPIIAELSQGYMLHSASMRYCTIYHCLLQLIQILWRRRRATTHFYTCYLKWMSLLINSVGQRPCLSHADEQVVYLK